MSDRARKVVLCAGVRTPIGHAARSLASLRAEDLMQIAVESLLARTKLPKDAVDGLAIGWAGQGFSAPNLARVTLGDGRLYIAGGIGGALVVEKAPS